MHLTIERRTGAGSAARGTAGEAVEASEPVDLILSGRLDAESGVELEHAVAEEIQRGTHAIRLDFTAVSFLSSAGIRILFNVHRAAKAAGGTCLVSAASEPVARVLELTKLAPILMEPPAGGAPAPKAGPGGAAAKAPAAPADQRFGGIVFSSIVPPGKATVTAALVGSAAALRGAATAEAKRVPRTACGLGIAALADDVACGRIAGEMAAACGAVFHRPPQPFAAVDYLLGAENLVPIVHLASGLVWEGVPQGRAWFEPAADAADDRPFVRFDELAERILDLAAAEQVAFVVVAEVHGLVGVELIRPLAEATADDNPATGTAAVVARWLSFSREPAHARHTALVVGVAARGGPVGPLADFVRPLGTGAVQGHAHAVVFPLRPLKRGAANLAAAVDDLAASEPVAVMHLLGDPQPVLGSGQSELVRGSCWFAPLTLAGGPG
jgi:anti-anti-sigma factor